MLWGAVPRGAEEEEGVGQQDVERGCDRVGGSDGKAIGFEAKTCMQSELRLRFEGRVIRVETEIQVRSDLRSRCH
eukprot:1755381-Rhodomonas_salina.1